ncbi:MAG: hypothetical protein ACE5PV_02190 [Candidatus Poribacteria bacterium]
MNEHRNVGKLANKEEVFKDSPKLRAAVIACGRISRAHAHGYRANPEIELVAGADINREALDASSARATLEVLMSVCESSRRRTVIQLPLAVLENPLFEMLKQQNT